MKSVFTNLTFLADRGAFRLFFWWLSSTAGYVPGNEAQLSLSDMASHKRVLSYGCYPFLSGRPGIPFGLPWQAFRPQRRASLATSNRSAVALSQSLATPFADPFAGLKDRNLRDAESYTEKNFSRQSFVCFISPNVFYFFFAEKSMGFLQENQSKEFEKMSEKNLLVFWLAQPRKAGTEPVALASGTNTQRLHKPCPLVFLDCFYLWLTKPSTDPPNHTKTPRTMLIFDSLIGRSGR